MAAHIDVAVAAVAAVEELVSSVSRWAEEDSNAAGSP